MDTYSEASHTLLDGSAVTLSTTAPVDLSQEPTNFMYVSRESRKYEFGAGGRTFADVVAADVGVAYEKSFALSGGEVLLGYAYQSEDPDIAPRLYWQLTWRGARYSLKTFQYGGEGSLLLEILSDLTPVERPDGLMLHDASGSPVSPETDAALAPCLVKRIPGLGRVDVYQYSTQLAMTLPKRSGRSVLGGELFVDASDRDHPPLLLIGDAAITRIVPDWNLAEADVVNGASRLKVVWDA